MKAVEGNAAAPNQRARSSKWRLSKWLLPVFLLLLLLVGGFVIWASQAAPPMSEALSALQSDNRVTVEAGEWLVFEPVGDEPNTGLIIYPGARVDARAYAPAAHAIAANGYLVVIVPMPLNLAVFGADRADDIIDAYPRVQRWAMAGHSLGGVMAAHFAHDNPVRVQGLVLWASYPQESDSLAQSAIPVTSIYGTLDGLSTEENIEASRKLLPSDTRWVVIEGGNHAQFGWYGPQDGDLPAKINHSEQQKQIVSATEELLAVIAK